MAEIRIGTSGFAYAEWKPSFYPKEVSQKKFLEFYASRFEAVEIDYTFYRMPNRKTLEGWREKTPGSFRFALKASRRITHFGRLKVPSESLEYLLEVLPVLGERLGILLFQLPPNLKCDLERLEAFLGALPATIPFAFEFRHESWFNPDVYSLLRRSGAALCIHDADDHTTPVELTASRTYVRLRRSEYPAGIRREWQERFRSWASDGIGVFAFIKHEDNPDAPRIAMEFAKGLQK